MEREFNLLSVKEEKKLSAEELKEYYTELRKYLEGRKLTNTTPGATTVAPKLKKISNILATQVTKMFSSKNVEWVCDGQENLPQGGFLIAQSHQGILDGFVWIPKIDRHCLVLHGGDVNKLLLYSQYNTGLVIVKKAFPGRDSEEKIKEIKNFNYNGKLDMIQLLQMGFPIVYSPESTWNLSPNKLHLPINYGFLDIAKKSGVPVIPAVHEFTYDSSTEKEVITKIHTKFGTPIYIGLKDDIEQKLEEFQEAISTMKWELLEEKGIFKRKNITTREYINYLKGNYKNLKFGKLDWEKERANIYGANSEFYQFHHINDIPFDENGNLLETEEVIKLKKINEKHHIG